MLTSTIRKWTELSSSEKGDIFTNMSLPWTKEERDSMRESLSRKYWITEWTITSLIAHETMRRMKNWEWAQSSSWLWDINTTQTELEWLDENLTHIVQESTQASVYAITTLSEFTEEMREGILEEFWEVIRGSATDSVYDYYQDIEALSDYYNIETSILEQFLRNRYGWLWIKLDELKKWRILTEEDKMNIRIYVASWSDEKDKKVRRKEMAMQYWVSIRIIWPITAWKLNESGGKVLKKDDSQIEGLIVPEIKSELVVKATQKQDSNQVEQDLTVNTWNIQEDSKDTESEQKYSNIDAVYIKDLVLEYNLQDNGQRWAFLQHVFDLFPDASIEDVKKVIPDFPDDTKHENLKRSWEWMWALVEYDNEIKNKWRQKLKEFIDENIDKEKRKDMKVLCLPGVECLEIPLYIELGFRPENIVWVESWEVDPKNLKPEAIEKLKKYADVLWLSFEITKPRIREILTKTYLKNADKFWIQTRIWMLDKVLEKEVVIFDVVSLDFVWPISLSSRLITQRVNLNDKAVICTNYLNRREGDFWKRQLFAWNLSKDINSKPYYQDILNEIDVSKNREINVPFWEDRSDSHHVAILKQFTLESWRVPSELKLQLSKYRELDSSKVVYQKKIVDMRKLDDNEYAFMYISDIRQVLFDAFGKAFHNAWLHNTWNEKQRDFVNLQIWGNLSKITVLFQDLIFSEYVIDSTNKSSYKYIGNTNSPMYSDFFVIRKLSQKEKAPFKKSINFFYSVIHAILNQKLPTSITIKRKNKNLPVFDLEDEIVLSNPYGVELASIKIRNLENARFEWKKIYWDPYSPPIRERLQ